MMKIPDEEYLNICRQKIATLAKEKAEFDKICNGLNQEIRVIKLHAIKEKWGIEIGSFVRMRDKTYRVSFIDLKFGDIEAVLREVPWIKGNLQKADGTFSILERNLFDDWVLVE